MKDVDKTKIRRTTNVDDLLGRSAEHTDGMEQDQNPPQVTEVMEKRSTTDPYSINFADVDLAEHIGRATPRVRAVAWVLRAAPPIAIWLLLLYKLVIASNPHGAHVIDLRSEWEKVEDWLFKGIILLVTLLLALYWPYHLLRKRRK
jgi:hypothetical protein